MKGVRVKGVIEEAILQPSKSSGMVVGELGRSDQLLKVVPTGLTDRLGVKEDSGMMLKQSCGYAEVGRCGGSRCGGSP